MRQGGRSVTADVDLDALAAGYRHRPPTVEMLDLARAIAREADLGEGEWALDIGGGFGGHAATWTELGLRPVVVDPSAAMRRRAGRRHGVAVVGSRGEALPFVAASVGLFYAHLSIHYTDAPRTLDEALRVVRPGGSIAIGTLGPRHHFVSFLARWFPSIAASDAVRFPAPDGIARQLAAAGATQVRIEPVDIAKTRPAAEWRLAVVDGFVSSLQFVSAAEMDEGLAAFDGAHPDPDEAIDYVIRYDWVHARR